MEIVDVDHGEIPEWLLICCLQIPLLRIITALKWFDQGTANWRNVVSAE